MKKALPTLGVLGVYTGRVLSVGGFDQIHEVLDHFYPGIMTLGCAMALPTAQKEVLRQVPAVAEIPSPGNNAEWGAKVSAYAALALEKFGPTIELEGPHGTGGPDMITTE